MKSGIYIITNKINTKVYIGSSIGVNGRLAGHKNSLKRGDHHSQHLQRSWNKYGEENFTFELLEYVKEEKLIEREQHYIDFYESYLIHKGYNISPTAGNCLGIKRTEETKQKLRGINFGKKHSEKTKKKISATIRENPDWRKSITSDEYREKMRQLNLGENNPMWGKTGPVGEDHHMWGKFGKDHHRARKISQYTKEGEFIREWDSLADAERGGFNHSNVCSCCSGRIKSAYGFIWKWVS